MLLYIFDALAASFMTNPAQIPDFRILFESAPGLYLVLLPDWRNNSATPPSWKASESSLEVSRTISTCADRCTWRRQPALDVFALRTDADSAIRENIVDAGDRAVYLTRQMLAYSGKGAFQIRELDLSELIRGISTRVQSFIPKAAHLRLELPDEHYFRNFYPTYTLTRGTYVSLEVQ